jgi:hypothetical protein
MNPAESTTNSTRTVPPSWRTADSEGYFLALLIFAEASDVHSCHVRGTCGGGEEVWATLGQDGIQIARKNSADAEKLAVRTERPLTIGPRLLSLTSQDPFSIHPLCQSSSSFPRPPNRGRISCGNLSGPKCHQATPLVRIAPQLRTVLTSHVALKLVNRRVLWSTNNIERHRLARVAADAPHFKVHVARVRRVTQCRRRLRWSLIAQHSVIPRLTRQPISNLAGLLGALGGHADCGAVKALAGLRGHATSSRRTRSTKSR